MKLSTRLFSLISKNKPLKATLAITGFLLTTATLSIASTVLTANKASAELITSRGFGVSLNTNYNYRRIYGEPRMSVYATNPNDGDQQFDRIQGNAGWMLKHRGTGKCLNAYSKYSGAEPFVWACNPADMDQNWDMLDKGNGYVLYRLKNTGLCLTADTPVGNSSFVALRDCAYNGANGTQDWIGSLNPNSPVYSGNANNYTTRDVQVTPLYEYWVVARRPAGLWEIFTQTDVGHAFNALVRKNQKVVQTLNNGVVVSTSGVQDSGGWYRYHTYGFWPSGLKVDVCSSGDGNDDCQNTVSILSTGKLPSGADYAVRKSRISESRANYIHQNLNFAGCSQYPKSVVAIGGSYCNCVDYASRSWYNFSSQWEDFRPKFWEALSPNELRMRINDKNVDGGFLDGGKTWQ
jgi:hypothetical protein